MSNTGLMGLVAKTVRKMLDRAVDKYFLRVMEEALKTVFLRRAFDRALINLHNEAIRNVFRL